jgi:glycine/D-amino acid oxidase-like deaminating enzyme
MAYDDVIIGAGVYGTAVAWELAKRGANVLVLEAETVACGASGGPGKRGVRACGRDVRELPLMRLAYDLWPRLADAIGEPTGYERLGGLHLIERGPDGATERLARAEARQWLQEQHDIPTQLLDRDAVLALEPAVSDDVLAALFCPLDGVADHTATTHGLARAAQRAGAEIREHTRVTGLVREGDRVTAVLTAQGERIAVRRSVLLLANTQVPTFVTDYLGITLPVWPMLPQVVVMEPAEALALRHLIGHDSRTLAMKPVTGRRVMISGGWRGRWNAETGHAETVPEQVRGNVAEAVAVFPSLAGVRVEVADASRPEAGSVDDIPIVDTLPGARNLLMGTGWSGHGFAISLAVAQLLAKWADGGERPALLQPFSYRRLLPLLCANAAQS